MNICPGSRNPRNPRLQLLETGRETAPPREPEVDDFTRGWNAALEAAARGIDHPLAAHFCERLRAMKRKS